MKLSSERPMKAAPPIVAYFTMAPMGRRKYHYLVFRLLLQALKLCLRVTLIHPFGPSLFHHLEQTTRNAATHPTTPIPDKMDREKDAQDRRQ